MKRFFYFCRNKHAAVTTSQYIHRFLLLTLTVCIFGACSSTKFVPDSEYLLDRVEVSCQDKSLDAATLEPYIRQQTNSKWFSVFKIPLYTYSLAGRDTTAWLNRKLKSIGEEPVIYDPIQEELSRKDLIAAMHNLGYMHAQVEVARKHIKSARWNTTCSTRKSAACCTWSVLTISN